MDGPLLSFTSLHFAFFKGFHDCVGGCDGCININNDSNAGLDTAITIMEDVYSTITAAGIGKTNY